MTVDLEAGPELNERVARIMGWEHVRRCKRKDMHCKTGCGAPIGKPTDRAKSRCPVPDFSGSPSGAAIVKNWLREQDWCFVVEFVADQYVAVRSCHGEPPSAMAPEEPLALCRFAVALHEEGVV